MNNLDDIKFIEEMDRLKMRDIIAGLPEHVKQAYQLGKDFALSANFREARCIVFCGMGGSAIGAEIISCYLRSEMKIPIYINRDYTLPVFVDKDCLVILISYSGNTEEMLSAYNEAQAKGAKIIVITSGGQLMNLARNDAHPCLLIPGGFPPRGAVAFLCIPLIPIFAKLEFIKDKEDEIKELSSVLQGLQADSLGLHIKAEINPAKRLARRIFNNFCVIYGASANLSAAVTRWRGQFAENSKALSSTHLLPEMNHNEIVGWRHPRRTLQRFIAVFLRDKEDHPQVRKRIEISKEILQNEGVAVEEIWSKGVSLLARMFYLIYIGDYASFYLAVLNGEDPTPVKRIDYLKQRLKEL